MLTFLLSIISIILLKSYNPLNLFSIFTPNKNNHILHANNKRLLLTSEDEYKLTCFNNKTNTTLEITEEKFSLDYIFTAFLQNFTDYDVENIVYLEDAVNGNTSALVDLGRKVFVPFAVLVAFAVITLISWLVYCFCCCSPKFCCHSKETNEPKVGCKTVAFVFFVISLLGIVVICCIGFIYTDKFNKNLNKFECSVLRFDSDTKFGQDIESSPKWLGYENIPGKLNQMKGVYLKIENEYKSIFRVIDWVEADKNTLKSRLNEIFIKYKDSLVINPNADVGGYINPDFIQVSNCYLVFYKFNSSH